ncbi:MAG TPA: hypothetical protein VHT91_36485 [Kofleriaceae bacterium]|nr:hypothetical protein [Kofleriaceae bacterium]
MTVATVARSMSRGGVAISGDAVVAVTVKVDLCRDPADASPHPGGVESTLAKIRDAAASGGHGGAHDRVSRGEPSQAAGRAMTRHIIASPRDGGEDRSDHVHLHARLLKLTDALFEQLLLEARIDRNLFAPRSVALAVRAQEVAELAQFDTELCRRLMRLLDERAPWTSASTCNRSDLAGDTSELPPATAKPAGRTPTPTGIASAEVRERLAGMKREVAATLKMRPRALEQLVARIGGCDPVPELLADRLVGLRGSEAAAHVLSVSDEQPATTDGDADRAALHTVLFAVLPYVSDWRDEVAACCARGERQPGVVELRYRSDTIAEAVMAGWVGRRCWFEYRAGSEPYGVGAVQIPATAQTALFTSEQHLLEGVVKQLMYQLGVGGLTSHEQRTRVLAALRRRDQRTGPERMRYYFLFRDAASPEDPGVLWHLARTTLHGESGLPGLVLIRMQGQLSDAEADLEECIAAILKPRTPSRT